jgi:hypothetical protein
MVKIAKLKLIPVALLNVSMVESVWSLWSQSTLSSIFKLLTAYTFYRRILLESPAQDYLFYVNVQMD